MSRKASKDVSNQSTVKMVAVCIVFDPNKQDSDMMRHAFEGLMQYDGGGYCFITGMRDVVFYAKKEDVDLREIRRVVRNVRRRVGVESVLVDVYDEDDESTDED